MQTMERPKTFKDLGVIEPLCEACDALGYKVPTPVQEQAIPAALDGKDLLCQAAPDSGTTAAFVLPVLQALVDNPQSLHSLILVPTSELVLEISQAVEALGTVIPVRCVLLIEGNDVAAQETALSQEPHVIVATPHCMLGHLEHTQRLSLLRLKYLVLDEADRLVDFGFRPVLHRILDILPPRTTYIFATTISDEVDALQRDILSDPVEISAPTGQPAPTQSVILTPLKEKDIYLAYILDQRAGQTGIIYTQKRLTTQHVAAMVRYLGFSAIPVHGQLSDSARQAALAEFRAGSWDLLVVTGASVQGLDIPSVDFAVNYEPPGNTADYMHRVECAAAGGSGMVISFVTQYDVELWIRIQNAIGEELDELEINRDEAMMHAGRVKQAQRAAESAQDTLRQDI